MTEVPSDNGRVILSPTQFQLTLDRLCHKVWEEYGNFEQTCIIAIQPRGTLLGDRFVRRLGEITGVGKIPYGLLDITFYRDDFRRRPEPLAPSATMIDFLVEEKRVLLIDDVLYTGRTISAAMQALAHFGRPRQVELLTLVDRRFNRHLPIQADFVGITVDALEKAYVQVQWGSTENNHQVLLYAHKHQK